MARPPRGPIEASQSLQDVAFEWLRSRIVIGEYPPGTFLSARELAEELNMSKTPVNAALGRLGEQGYVVVSPQRGVIVRALTLRETVDHFDLRTALEPHVMRKVAGHLSANVIRDLEELLERQAEAIHNSDPHAYVPLSSEFHITLSDASGNQEIASIMRTLRDRLNRVIEMNWQPQHAQVSLQNHREILGYLVAGDGEAAARVMNLHLRRAIIRWGETVGNELPSQTGSSLTSLPE